MDETIKRTLFDDIKDYLRSIGLYIPIMAIIFFAFMYAGYIYSSFNPDFSADLIEEIAEGFKGMIDLPPFLLAFAIFFRNSSLCLITITLGLFIGIVPMGFIVFNGFLVGVVAFEAGQKMGLNYVLLGILPHGVIELPMIIICAAIGFKLGVEVMGKLFKKETDIKKEFFCGLQVFVYMVLPLLFVAAMIEAYITPALINVGF